MKRNKKRNDIATQNPEEKKEFLRELEQEELDNAAGGFFGWGGWGGGGGSYSNFACDMGGMLF